MRKRPVQSANMINDNSGPSTVCHILLVEDDPPVRERLANIIRQWTGGRLVADCATFAEASEAIRNNPIDLLITDLKLPDGHGVQAIRMLRDQPAQCRSHGDFGTRR